MFGKEIDDHITMLQKIVALLRDLVLILVVALTAVIFFFGGDPKSMNTFDWATLVGAAVLIVAAPLLVYAILRLSNEMYLLTLVHYGVPINAKPEKGLCAFIALKVLRMTRRRYMHPIYKGRKMARQRTVMRPRLQKALSHFLGTATVLQSPVFNAFAVFALAILLFIITVRKYLPH
jgi:hypothetical protein